MGLFCVIMCTMKVHKLEQPQRTFFFERHDGSIIAVNEREAWSIYNNRNQMLGVRYERPKLIGTSEGLKMFQAVKESHELFKTDQTQAIARLKTGEQEELEAARGNIVPPRDMDKMGTAKEFI